MQTKIDNVAAVVTNTIDDGTRCVIDVEYDKFVRERAVKRDPQEFSNKSCSHALSILRTVFDIAEKEVNIFSGQLEPFVYNDPELRQAARTFLEKRSGNLNILLQTEIDSERTKNPNDFLYLAAEFKNKCHVRYLAEGHVFKRPDVSHFLVSDKRAYRIEMDTKEHTAVCSFEDKVGASEITDVFNLAWDANTSPLTVA